MSYRILKRNAAAKPMACVQPQEKVTSSDSQKATLSTKPLQVSSKQNLMKKRNNSERFLGRTLVELSGSKPKKYGSYDNPFLYHRQPINFVNFSPCSPHCSNFFGLVPLVQTNLPYQPCTYPVASSLSQTFGYNPWLTPVTTVPLITPAQFYPQFMPVLPTYNFAENVWPGTSTLPNVYDNFSIFDTGFDCSYYSPIERYSSALSYTSTLSLPSPAESNSSVVWPSLTSETDAASTVSRSTSTVTESIEEISTPSRDPLELYLSLPVDLFPKIRTLSVDPNPIIDVFCKVHEIHEYEPWLLDLEYGVPRSPVTRPIATYDVQYNSIHCKNTPGAIHPGFENCSNDFKKVVLFYYDSIVSAWYKGYTVLYVDVSVVNYQAWLRPPMQVFGMCWP